MLSSNVASARAVILGPNDLMLPPRETRDLALTPFDLEVTPTARVD